MLTLLLYLELHFNLFWSCCHLTTALKCFLYKNLLYFNTIGVKSSLSFTYCIKDIPLNTLHNIKRSYLYVNTLQVSIINPSILIGGGTTARPNYNYHYLGIHRHVSNEDPVTPVTRPPIMTTTTTTTTPTSPMSAKNNSSAYAKVRIVLINY